MKARADEEWRKRPMTQAAFLVFVCLGTALLLCGLSVHSTVVAASGVVILGATSYARMRTLRAEHRGQQ